MWWLIPWSFSVLCFDTVAALDHVGRGTPRWMVLISVPCVAFPPLSWLVGSR